MSVTVLAGQTFAHFMARQARKSKAGVVAPASLTMHRNNVAQRKQKALRSDMISDAKYAVRHTKDLNGYALVVWDDEKTTISSWRCGDMPGLVLPELCKNAILRAMINQDD